MKNETLETPVTNRGVINTCRPSLISIVDWFSCTFKNATDWREICGVFLLDSTLFTEQEKGKNGYKKSAVYRGIEICYDGTPEMGVFINLSGQACREYELTFETNGFSWSSFFKYLLGYQINITRLDLAIDDFHGYFNLKQIENKVKSGCVVSRFRTARNFEEHLLVTGETLGQTIYFGKSDVMIRFYDKLEEREAKQYIVDNSIEFWQRTELQIRKERAMEACSIISRGGDLGVYICGILRNYLDFKVKGTDTNRARWTTCKWWVEFLGDADRLKLTQVHPFPTIIRTKNWIDNQVVGSIGTLYTALNDDELFFDYLKALGKKRMTKEQKKLAEDFKQKFNNQISLKTEMRRMIKLLNKDNTEENELEAERFWKYHKRRK